jgi:hypothetical protein
VPTKTTPGPSSLSRAARPRLETATSSWPTARHHLQRLVDDVSPTQTTDNCG